MAETHRDGRFNGPDGLSLYFQYWFAPQPRAVVLIAHGAGEHCSRYQPLASFLTGHGFTVAALDHPGHGKSDGTYGHVERFSQYRESLGEFREKISADFPGLPIVLLGHSMGGLISADYLIGHQQEFIGCALSGPAIASELEPGALQIGLIRLLSRFLPTLGVMQLEAGGISRDPRVVQEYTSDPLVHHGKYSARFVSELFATMQRVQEEAQKISLPLLLMHGEADSMTSPKGSKLLFERVSSKQKTLKLYPGLYHEIFNEPEHEQVFADLLAWCETLPGLPLQV
ncbi:lysophospholipase [Haliea sp. E17]|uniref:alpha/beta hydrolase n=1 Tax=Haliea sp. E17 TaxID=3401576 RepID=UPI003AAEA118